MLLSPQTLRWLHRAARPLAGRRVLLTGATGSLGRCASQELLELGARLLLPVRDMEKGAALRAELLSRYPDADITLETVDMASFASVDALAARLLAKGKALDCLINNAGVFSRAGIRTADGLELHEQVNARSPLRLTRALLPLLSRADDPRVVTVTSLAAWNARAGDGDPLALQSATAAYGRSKLILMRGILALRAQAPDVAFLFAQPGICATGLFRAGEHPTAYGEGVLKLVLPLMRRVFMPPEKAALTTVYAVCSAEKRALISAPRGPMGVWGYPHMRGLWRRVRATG